ncbi:hypothetical protein PAXRUDRAFT_505616 [Paxillus rubicundulus Ve08.2h10]|uniref:Uncharacterized protein n=1 Tax=Paxillus rubicundulus Ve08.2h10 TaxID=930991 RepID=A0A0D0DLM3_9AGAM|nr:hypothetical protein PAXRUDRAFT_505616 [Paxillus rubicundulus Ve08.2h10]
MLAWPGEFVRSTWQDSTDPTNPGCWILQQRDADVLLLVCYRLFPYFPWVCVTSNAGSSPLRTIDWTARSCGSWLINIVVSVYSGLQLQLLCIDADSSCQRYTF